MAKNEGSDCSISRRHYNVLNIVQVNVVLNHNILSYVEVGNSVIRDYHYIDLKHGFFFTTSVTKKLRGNHLYLEIPYHLLGSDVSELGLKNVVDVMHGLENLPGMRTVLLSSSSYNIGVYLNQTEFTWQYIRRCEKKNSFEKYFWCNQTAISPIFFFNACFWKKSFELMMTHHWDVIFVLVNFGERLVKLGCNDLARRHHGSLYRFVRHAVTGLLQSCSWQVTVVPIKQGNFLAVLGCSGPQRFCRFPPMTVSCGLNVTPVKEIARL